MPSPPTIAELAAKHGATLTFDCRPCGRHKFYHGEELAQFVARFPPEMTWEYLKPRTVCPQCRMPVDGVFRTFEFSFTDDLTQWEALGLTPRGRRGPRG
jgi:hypothetical protein